MRTAFDILHELVYEKYYTSDQITETIAIEAMKAYAKEALEEAQEIAMAEITPADENNNVYNKIEKLINELQ